MIETEPEWSISGRKERKTMTVYIKNLYGIKGDRKAYYRKNGECCFEFVNQKKFASDLIAEEVAEILAHSDYYTKMYRADTIGTEE